MLFQWNLQTCVAYDFDYNRKWTVVLTAEVKQRERPGIKSNT